MAMRGVLAQTGVGDYAQAGMGLFERPDGLLHNAFVGVGLRPLRVLVGRDAEQQA